MIFCYLRLFIGGGVGGFGTPESEPVRIENDIKKFGNSQLYPSHFRALLY